MLEYNVNKFLDQLRENPLESTYGQLEEFEKTSIYRDLVRLWFVWIDDARNLHEAGKFDSSQEFIGMVNAFKQTLQSVSHLKSISMED